MPSDLELLGRLVLATLAGTAIGTERELSGQHAGLRTHTLLALGACLFTLISAYAFAGPGVDPTRIAAQIVSGIGFLGGGVILRQGLSIRGITTAASIWATCALGVALGTGMYLVGGGATALVLATLVLLRAVRNLLRRAGIEREALVVRTTAGFELRPLLDTLAEHDATISNLEQERRGGGAEITIAVKFPRGAAVEDLLDAVSRLDGVRSVEWGD